ncbi:hypothetical protein G7066_04395 [Leucobacter coleopterorum]|uniref:Helix-turn-helix domain-containing protein n=1 Tax=Leucobacter coleopterorum TaxID=2714933 RepID=A0ABX6JUY2_9MICO|nr:hypothetical protein [Leucobacter coleopterorum]QIM18085.1 hypothetical protein G7066_04395 [Leucobacter coleopterorum]
MTTRPRLTVTQAVAAFNVTKRTLQRGLAAGDLDGATKDNSRQWPIPVEALHALGFVARQATPNGASPTPDGASEITSLRSILHDTQQQLETERRLREAAETNANDLRTAMRMLKATAATPAPLRTNRRRWWQG